MMDASTLRLILALLVESFALFLAAMNGYFVFRGTRNEGEQKSKGPSLVPMVSLVVCYLAYAIAPAPVEYWMWTAAVLDVGNWMIVIGVPLALIRAAQKKGGESREGQAE